MHIKAAVTSIILLEIVTLTLPTEDEVHAGVMFRDQPIDQKLGCGMTEVQFLCDYVVGGQTNRPFPTWIINSRPFSSNELPHNHTFNGSVLSIHNVSLAQNNTSYQCVVGVFSGQGQRILYYNSTVGHLIIKCRAPDVRCVPVYEHETNQLIAVLTNITQDINFKMSYIITYSDFASVTCQSCNISAPDCVDRYCSHNFSIPAVTPLCSNTSYINVTVTGTDVSFKRNLSYADPIKIDTLNKFVNLSSTLTKKDEFGINCTFMNQIKQIEKVCDVQYNDATVGCQNSSLKTGGSTSSRHWVDIGLTLTDLGNPSEICFIVTASVNGTMTVRVQGMFKNNEPRAASISVSTVMIISIVQGLASTMYLS